MYKNLLISKEQNIKCFKKKKKKSTVSASNRAVITSSRVPEREQCIELLKALLKMDEDKMNTPPEVLIHPFITKDYPK